MWSPHLKHIENVKRQSTETIPGFKKLTYEERLEKLKLQKYRSLRGIGMGVLIVVYNILHGFMFFFNDERVTSELFNIMYQAWIRGHSLKLIKHKSRLERILHFQSGECAASVNAFENRLDKLWFNHLMKDNLDTEYKCKEEGKDQ